MNKILTYEEFGAKGDGVTDDFAAIARTHDEANRCGATVKGSANATYYIGKVDKPAIIRTNVDWCGAHFVIDDRTIRHDAEERKISVFEVARDTEPMTVTVPEGMTLAKGQTNIGLSFAKPCMLLLQDTSDRIFIRWGENANAGFARQEMILVDALGNVDPSTPIQYDYNTVTDITAYSIDDAPITVANGFFTTVVCDPRMLDPAYTNAYHYYFRNILVTRSHVVLENVNHTKIGEHETVGVPYVGFYTFRHCYHVTLQNASIIGQLAYSFMDINKNTGAPTRNEMGSYEINAGWCVALSLIGLKQQEDPAKGALITNRKMYHGTMGSDFCRNVLMDGCYLDRFDAHTGLHNATIRNSTLGFGILAIGGGTLRIENVTRLSNNVGNSGFVHLRDDYNSVFDGELIIQNCVAKKPITALVAGRWLSFYNGLPNHMINKVTIDGLTVEEPAFALYDIRRATAAALTDAINPLYAPEEITIANMNIQPVVCADPAQEGVYTATKIRYV